MTRTQMLIALAVMAGGAVLLIALIAWSAGRQRLALETEGGDLQRRLESTAARAARLHAATETYRAEAADWRQRHGADTAALRTDLDRARQAAEVLTRDLAKATGDGDALRERVAQSARQIEALTAGRDDSAREWRKRWADDTAALAGELKAARERIPGPGEGPPHAPPAPAP